jgi:transposase-like protein
MTDKKVKRKYTEEFRKEAVALVYIETPLQMDDKKSEICIARQSKIKNQLIAFKFT